MVSAAPWWPPTWAAGGAGVSWVQVQSLNPLLSGGNSLIHGLLVSGGVAVLHISTAGLKTRHKITHNCMNRLIGRRRGPPEASLTYPWDGGLILGLAWRTRDTGTAFH